MTSPELPPTAKPIREQAAAWLLRANAPEWNAQSQQQLEAWLAASEFHRASYWRLEAAWAEASRLAALRPLKRPGGSLRRLFNPVAWKVVAASLLFAVAGMALYQVSSPPDVREYATPIGGHRTLTLPDGTVIELNTDTVIRITNDLRKPKVWLTKGEAYFQVVHNPQRPFIVYAGDHKVTDLGTKFVVHRTEKGLEVVLFEGRAQLDSIGRDMPQRSTELSPGEIAIATRDSMSVTKKSMQKLANELSWRKGLLIFDGTTLADAVADFNRYNVEKIVIRDPSIMQMRVNGTFPVHAKQEFVDVAQAVFGLRVESQGDNTLISR